MRVGLYYSVLSWRYPGYFDADGTNAQTNNFGIKTASWHKENATLMKAELYEQVKELMTQYGSIDDLWWDGGWMALKGTDRDGAGFWEPGLYRDPGNKWAGGYGTIGTDSAAAGRYLGIMGMVRKYQPYILSNPRSGWIGDYANEEGYAEIKGPIRKEYWEKCLSLNKDGWGYTKKQQVMSSGEVIDILINAVIRNGNLLLNVGPDQHGVIPEGQRQALAQIGSWMRKAGESIYGTTAGPWDPVDRQYGFTYRANRLYVHILENYKGNTFQVPAIDKRIIRCYDVYTGKTLQYSVNADHTITVHGIDRTSSKVDTVVGIEFDSAV
jgi:alpha-L-fucosidase